MFGSEEAVTGIIEKKVPPIKSERIENINDNTENKNKSFKKQENDNFIENISVSEDNCQSVECKSIKVESQRNTAEDKIENILKNELSKEK